MLEEFTSLGKWWLPDKPEVVLPGKLSFSPERGATLELIGSFYDSPFEEINRSKNTALPNDNFPVEESLPQTSGVPCDFINPEENIILGFLENNENITLYRCFGQIKRFEFVNNRSTLFFDVNYVFKKIHFPSEQDIKFKSISVRYSNLERWVGTTGISLFHTNEEPRNSIGMLYHPPSKISLVKIGSLDLEITFSQISTNPFIFYKAYYKANLEQKTYLTIQNPDGQPLEECIALLIHFRDLLSFAMTKPTAITEITGKVDVIYPKPVQQDDKSFTTEEESGETQVTLLFGLGNSIRSSDLEISDNDMLFLFRDLDNRLGTVFETWIEKREKYESVFELFLITLYTPQLYLHYGFLNIIQALEAYHTVKNEGLYQDENVYKRGLYQKFLEVLKDFPSEESDPHNGISEKFREALIGKLQYQAQFSLETRLKELIGDIGSLLPDNFIGKKKDRKSFSHRASYTRNALTHHDREKRKKAAKDRELFQLFHTLITILRICLLKELNLSDDSIKRLVERNRKYQDEWRPSSKSLDN